MKIIISHTQSNIDPSSTYSGEAFPTVLAGLESEYSAALKITYPDAEIEFIDSDDTYSVKIGGTGTDDPSEIEDDVSRICSDVFETGRFWI